MFNRSHQNFHPYLENDEREKSLQIILIIGSQLGLLYIFK